MGTLLHQIFICVKGYDLDELQSAHPLAVFGSRASGCHLPDSDWDVVVLTAPVMADRGDGLDYLQEDPPNDPGWYSRDLAFHLTGYAVWLNGGPNWDPALLDWNRAIERKLKKIRATAKILGRATLLPVFEAKRIKELLPSVTAEDFKEFGVSDDFLRFVTGPDMP